MTGDRDRLRDLAAAYALDALDPDEKLEFEELLSTSLELQREVDEFREVSGLLAHGAPVRQPSSKLWQRLQDRTVGGPDATEVVPLVTRPPQYSRFAWAAAAAGLLVAGGVWLRNRDLSAVIANQDVALEGVMAELSERDALVEQVLGSNTSVFTLTSAATPAPTVRVFWNRDTNVWVLRAFNLTPTAPGQTYQFWFIQDGAAVPSVTFNSEADGNATIMLTGPDNATGITGAAVSEEPAGGSREPTTVVLIGEVE